MTLKMPLLPLIAVFVFGVVALGGYLVRDAHRLWGTVEKRHVVFSPKWIANAQFAGEFVAKDLGYYDQEGLDVRIDEYDPAHKIVDLLENGSSTFGLMNANDVLIERSRGRKITAVAAFYQISPYVVATLQQKGITSPFQLKGRTIGIKGGIGSEANVVFQLLLSSAGLSTKDATFKQLDIVSSEKSDLYSEQVDALGFYRTRIYQFEKEGLSANLLYPERYGSSLYNDVLVVSDAYLQEHPDEVRAFIRATVKGWQFAFLNKDRAVDITLKHVKNEEYNDAAYQQSILARSESLIMPHQGESIGIMTASRWKTYYVALANLGLIETPFDVEDVFTNEYLSE